QAGDPSRDRRRHRRRAGRSRLAARDRARVTSAWAAELAPRIEALGRRVAVGISGPDCAGKSTLAAELGLLVDGALVVSGDEFTRPTRDRYGEPEEGLGYYRDSFDYGELFGRLLPALRAGTVGGLML